MNEMLRSHMLACAEAVVNGLAVWCQDHAEADLEQREEEVLQRGRQLLGALLLVVATAAAPRSPGGCPHCRHWDPQPVVRARPRQVLSRLGLLRLPRQQYSCAACGKSWQPLDQALQLQPRQRMTKGLQSWLAELGAEATFRGAARLLGTLAGLAVGAETVRRHAEAVGQVLEEAQQAAIRTVEWTREAAEPVESARGQLVVEADGVLVRFVDGWHEVKIGIVAGCEGGKLVAPSYVAARESAERFGPRLLAEAARRGALEIVAWHSRLVGPGLALLRRVLVLGDGAVWIWHLAAEHFGPAIEIVDFFHAAEHLGTLAREFYGEGSPKARRWLQRQSHRLKHQGPEPLLRTLGAVRAHGELAKLLQRERAYFRTNAARMAYPTFHAQDLPIGSGAVESAAGHLVQHRFKRSGMRWSAAGGTALLTLRAHLASDRRLPPRAVRPRPLTKAA